MNERPRKEIKHTRWLCRRCGNHATFLYLEHAVIERQRLWSGRTHGYLDLPDCDHVVKVERADKPSKCAICGSKNITYTHTREWERPRAD